MYVQRLKEDFKRGAIIGDTTTPAGIVGDIVVGFIPFGDGRDVALQSYYLASGALDENGKPKYNKLVYGLAWLGLGADALIVTGVGEVINGAIGGFKTFVKLIDPVKFKAFYNALSDFIELAAKAAKEKNDWKMVENMVPFMQFAAVITFDKQLRDFLCGAICSADDLVVWLAYTAGWKDAPEEAIAGFHRINNAIDYFVDDAYASTSGFKNALRKLLDNFPAELPEDLGKAMTQIIHVLTEAMDEGSEIISEAYKEKTILAFQNIFKIGEKGSVADVAYTGSLGRPVNGTFFGRRVEELMEDLTKVNPDKIKENFNAARSVATHADDIELLDAAEDVSSGLKSMLSHLNKKFDTGNYPKGAAHQVRIVADMVDEVIGVELKRIAVKLKSGVHLGDREYDALVKINGVLTRMELKSWLPENIAKHTRSSLAVGVKNTEDATKGKQLLTDLVAFKENGYQGFNWGFDKGMVGNAKVFKDTVEDVLLHHKATREKIMGWLKIDDVDEYIDWADDLMKNLNKFIIVKTT